MAEQGWKGKKNGDLLQAAQQEFDVFITMDKGIEHQQNWKIMTLGFVIVSAKTNRYADVVPLMPQINAALHLVRPGQLIRAP